MPKPLDPALVDQIRESLFSGRGVRLFGDEPPVSMLEASTEMTAEGDVFLDSKLEKVAELLERGFIVNIDSEGAVLARTPDGRSRYISTGESEIDVMDRLMVKTALEQGATVAFESDGSLAITAAATVVTVPADVAAAKFAEFERRADSGEIGAELAAGRDVQIDAAPVAAPVDTPADGTGAQPPIDDPFDTAAELAAEADSLQLGVEAARSLSLPEFAAEKQAAEAQRTAAERQLAMTTAERDAAGQQASSAQADAIRATESAATMRTDAADYRNKGDALSAASSEADAENFEAIAKVHSQTAAEAQEAFDDADRRVDQQTEEVDQATVASQQVNEKFSKLEEALDDQEEQLWDARHAASELAEVERLEAALPDLEARGVEGLDRIHAAIAQHRATADAYILHGNLRATTGIVVEGDPDGATDPEAISPDAPDPDEFVPGWPFPDDTDPIPADPGEVDPDEVDPDDFDPGDFVPEPTPFNMIDPDSFGPGHFDPEPLTPRNVEPDRSEPEDPTVNQVKPGEGAAEQIELKPVGPEDFQIEEPSEVSPPEGLSLDLDSAGSDAAMSAPADDFASDVADIAEIEDDLEGLTDF